MSPLELLFIETLTLYVHHYSRLRFISSEFVLKLCTYIYPQSCTYNLEQGSWVSKNTGCWQSMCCYWMHVVCITCTLYLCTHSTVWCLHASHSRSFSNLRQPIYVHCINPRHTVHHIQPILKVSNTYTHFFHVSMLNYISFKLQLPHVWATS